MRLVEIYRARYDGRTAEALTAVAENLAELTDSEWDGSLAMWHALMHLRGDCLLDLKQYEAAEAVFDEAYRRTGDGISLANRGYSRWALGSLDEAKSDICNSLLSFTDEEDKEISLRNLVSICLEMGDIREAENYLETARAVAGESFAIDDLQRDVDRAKMDN